MPATTIRYYEDQGSIRSADRSPNGYRVYGDRGVARLRFVNRARTLDLSPDDLAELVELWEHDRCGPVAQRLRDQIAERLTDTQRRLAALAALAGDLQRVLGRLQAPAHDGPCIEGQCVCLDDTAAPPSATALELTADDDTDVTDDEPIACSLDPDHMVVRVGDWQQLLAHATRNEPIPGGVSLWFPVDADLAGRLTSLAAAEQSCCSFFRFSIDVSADTPPSARHRTTGSPTPGGQRVRRRRRGLLTPTPSFSPVRRCRVRRSRARRR